MALFKRRGTPHQTVHTAIDGDDLVVHVRTHRNTTLGPMAGSLSAQRYRYPGLADASTETTLACLAHALELYRRRYGEYVPLAAVAASEVRTVVPVPVPPGRGGRGGVHRSSPR